MSHGALQKLESERLGEDAELEQLKTASDAAVRHASDFLALQPGLMSLPFLLKMYCEADGISLGLDLLSSNVYAVKGGIVLCPTFGDPETLTPQHVRATPRFHSAPYFDSVTVKWVDEDGAIQQDYAQLRLLFSVRTTAGVQRELALIRWYKNVSEAPNERDVLAGFDVARLCWDKPPRSHWSALAVLRPRGYYDIVDLQAIVERTYVVQDYAKADRFHLTPFKWS